MGAHAELSGRVAFVTGGTSGINLGIAERFAAEGMKVAVFSRSRDRVDAAVDVLSAGGGEALGLVGDVRDFETLEAAIAQTAEHFGPLDVLVAGAAGNFLCKAEALSANGFKTVVDIDLVGTFNAARAAFDHLRRPGGSIIAISAGQSEIPIPLQIHANAAKAGVNMVIRTLAAEWGEYGIRANVIIPGPIEDTEGVRRLIPDAASRSAMLASVPLGRFGTRAEVADLAAFLASDAAAYITGAIVPCDGGALLTRSRLAPDG